MTEHNERSKANDSTEEHEGISERRTSKLGYFLLFLMAVFIVIVGQAVLADLTRLPEKPEAPAGGVGRICSADLRDLAYVPAPSFTETDRKFGLDRQFDRVRPELEAVASLNERVSSLKAAINGKNRELEDLLKEYGLSLQEVIAGEEPLMDKPTIRERILGLRADIASLSEELAAVQERRDAAVERVAPEMGLLRERYEAALEHYEGKCARYKLCVFLLWLAFVAPFFAASLMFYLKVKKRNSPYTIVMTAVLCAFSVLLAQVMLVFLYKVLPAGWLERVFRLLKEIPYLRMVLYYTSILLVILMFGGIVCYIQKKAFSPRSVAMRRLKSNKCPGCSLALEPSYVVCPKCGYALKEKCPQCGNLRIRDLPYCPSCGSLSGAPQAVPGDSGPGVERA